MHITSFTCTSTHLLDLLTHTRNGVKGGRSEDPAMRPGPACFFNEQKSRSKNHRLRKRNGVSSQGFGARFVACPCYSLTYSLTSFLSTHLLTDLLVGLLVSGCLSVCPSSCNHQGVCSKYGRLSVTYSLTHSLTYSLIRTM